MHEFVLKVGESGSTEPPKKEGWASKQIYLMENELALPETPDCPSLIALYLQRNYDLAAIPPLFFYHMPLLQVLDLSNTSIKSLPKSLPNLVALKKLFLRECKLFMELSPQVGKLNNLEELDLDETQIMNLPVDIGKLGKLRLLKVSIYGRKNFSKRRQLQLSTVIHPETISNLSQLTELSINVDPSDKWWDDSVEAVVKGLCNSKRLRSLSLYLPNFQLLDYASLLYRSLPYFRFIVGHHKKRVISRVPHEAEVEFRKWQKCLKFVNGENIPFQIREVLKFSNSFYLDRHANSMNLSEFGNENTKMLKFCLLAECNKMEAIIDQSELSHGFAENPLESLQYLSIYYMKNLESIWKGPTHYGCMSKLKFLELHSCPQLSNIFSQALLENFVNLEEFILEDCPQVTSLVSHVSVKPNSNTFLPNLKRLLLLYLPKLVSISNGLFIAPRLERIGFYNCPNLKSLSKRELSSKTLRMIKGENQWWEDIKWNETEWGTQPDHLMCIFSPMNNEKDEMTQLAEDSDEFEAFIQNDGEHSDEAKSLDSFMQLKVQWPDCMVERTRIDNVTKAIPPPSLRIPPSMSLPYLTIPLNVEYPSGFSKTSGQLSDFLNSPGYNEQEIISEENCIDLSLSSSLITVPHFSNTATIATSKNLITASSSSSPPSSFISYENQKRAEWNTFCQFLKDHKPPLSLSMCSGANVVEFLRHLDQFGKTKVHNSTCPSFGQPNPPAPCPCPLRQAWGRLDALIDRLSKAYKEHGGMPERNPFVASVVRIYLREVRDLQEKASILRKAFGYMKRKFSGLATPLDGGKVIDEGCDKGSRDDLAIRGRTREKRVMGPWSPEEDAILSELVSKFGPRNWNSIARGIAGRSGRSCRLRWHSQLEPAIKLKPFIDGAKSLDIFTQLKGQWPDCMAERTRTDSVTKSIPPPTLRIPPSMSLPHLTITRQLNVKYPSGFSKTPGQLPDFLNGPGYNEQEIISEEETCLGFSLSSSLIRMPNFSNTKATIATNKNINTASSTSSPPSFNSSCYESQKRRDWSTFCRYLKSLRPPLSVSMCSGVNVIEFLRYLDQFGKTKVHILTCPFFGISDPPGPCTCPLRQAWGSLDALIGRLRAAYEEHGGRSEVNPFGARVVRTYLRETRDLQGKARGICNKKRKQRDQKVAPSTQPAQAKFADAAKNNQSKKNYIGTITNSSELKQKKSI